MIGTPASPPPSVADAPAAPAGARAEALVELLHRLKASGYRFVTPTPATHARVTGRAGRRLARNLADIFGWNLPFAPGLAPEIERLLETAEAIEREDGLLRARLRVASLDRWLFLHSAFPTDARDSVFFGPDSYRFAGLIAAETAGLDLPEGARIVDIGGGAGVGAFVAAARYPQAEVAMTEINPRALDLTRINALAAGLPIRLVHSADLDAVEGPLDLALANPPYLADEAGRAYRDGGGRLGAEVSIAMARMAAERLAPGGRLILYTGSAIVDGDDGLARALGGLAAPTGLTLRYRELDPDIFGEELDRPAYAEVDRIALVAAILDRPVR